MRHDCANLAVRLRLSGDAALPIAILTSAGCEHVGDRFERPRTAGEGEFAWYLNQGDSRSWHGTLLARKIRLRMRVSFDRCRRAVHGVSSPGMLIS
jgi:hypothetical protein